MPEADTPNPESVQETQPTPLTTYSPPASGASDSDNMDSNEGNEENSNVSLSEENAVYGDEFPEIAALKAMKPLRRSCGGSSKYAGLVVYEQDGAVIYFSYISTN